jgi:hypothetical protein
MMQVRVHRIYFYGLQPVTARSPDSAKLKAAKVIIIMLSITNPTDKHPKQSDPQAADALLPREIWVEIFDCFGDADLTAAMTLARTCVDLYSHRAAWLERENLHIINGESTPAHSGVRFHGLLIRSSDQWELYDRGECCEMLTRDRWQHILVYTRFYPYFALQWSDTWNDAWGYNRVEYHLYKRHHRNPSPDMPFRTITTTHNQPRVTRMRYEFEFDSGKPIAVMSDATPDICRCITRHSRDRSLLLEVVARSFSRPVAR